MSVELTLLIWSTFLAGTYISVQAMLWRMQKGLIYSTMPRDDEPPSNKWTARGERALRNFLETYGIFIALAVATELSGRSDDWTRWGAHIWFWSRWVYLPLYIFGVPYIRSQVWFVSSLGLTLMFFGVVL